jgi:hypothetical protein
MTMTAINNTLLADALGRSFHVKFLIPVYESGVYLIDCLNFHQGGQLELGLSDADGIHFGCYTLDRDITIKDLMPSVSSVRDELWIFHEAYSSIQLLASDTTGIDAVSLSAVLKIMNRSFDSLLRQLDEAIKC